MDDNTATDEIEERTAGISLSRRGSLAALAGFVGLSGVPEGAIGSAAALDDSAPRTWESDVDAQGHDLYNLGSVDVEHIHTSARDADRIVWKDDDGVFHADGADGEIASGIDLIAVTQAAVDSLSDGRTSKEKVLVASPGTVGPATEIKQIELPSYTTLDIPVTITVSDVDENLVIPVRARGTDHIEVQNLTVVGNPRYGLWFQSVSDVRLGNVEMRFQSPGEVGLGVRIDAFANGRNNPDRSTDVQIGQVAVDNSGHHAVETYGVDRIQVGQVAADAPSGCGLLLNDTRDATVDSVVASDVDVGGGYAAFRVANGTEDVTCDQVVMRRGARGVFGVSGSRNVTVGEVNIVGADANGILIQDCQNVTIRSGVVRNCNGEAVRIDSQSSQDHPPAEGVMISGLRIYDDRDMKQQTWGIRETGSHTKNNRIVNCDLRDAGTEGNLKVYSEYTAVTGNVAGGIDTGTVTLTSGASPAARVEGVSSSQRTTLLDRVKPVDDPGASFAWESHFAWDGDAEQWDLVFEWRRDPGSDLTVDYVVDSPQANLGRESGHPSS